MDIMNTTRMGTGMKGVKGDVEGWRVFSLFRPIPIFRKLAVYAKVTDAHFWKQMTKCKEQKISPEKLYIIRGIDFILIN